MTAKKPKAAARSVDEPHKTKLRDHIVAMLGLEGRIMAAVESASRELDRHPDASAILLQIRTMAVDHTEALRIRLMCIGGGEANPPVPEPRSRLSGQAPGAPQRPTSALQDLYGLLGQATFGYSVLHVVAHRQLDSSWAIEEGNTADLAEELMREYARALEILDTKGCEVTVWELNKDGLECRCVCPSCSLGICLCWVHGIATVIDARRPVLAGDKGPGPAAITVAPPRADSVAVVAGLNPGDSIESIDGQGLPEVGDVNALISSFQKAISAHAPGDKIRLNVRDTSGAIRNVQVPRDVVSPPAQQRRLAAIMFTDMVGFTALAQEDESRALELLEEHRALVRSVLPRHRGREVKTIGDAFLLEFSSALDATACAIDVQRAVRKRNQIHRQKPIYLRIGIHVGDLVSVSGDIYGDAVNIASRIEPMADPGGICVSQQVYDQVWNKVPVKMAELAKARLKNVSAPIGVYRISMPKSG